MTTPKELADKAMQQAEAVQATWHEYEVAFRGDVQGEIVKAANAHDRAETELHMTIDQLQAMAEASQATIRHLREAWATLHNLSADMEAGPVRQQMQKRAKVIRVHLDSLEQPDGTYQQQGGGESVAELVEAVDNVLADAECECPNSMRHDRGEHLSGCYLFDLNIARQRFASPPPARQGSGEPVAWRAETADGRKRIELRGHVSGMDAAYGFKRTPLYTAPPSAQQATGSGQVLTEEDDYKAWYIEAMVASNEAGFVGMSAADTIRALAAATQAQPEAERLRAEQAAAVMPLIGPLLDAWEAARGVHEFRDECPELHKMLRAIDNAMEGRAAQAQPEADREALADVMRQTLAELCDAREWHPKYRAKYLAMLAGIDTLAAPTTGKREPLTNDLLTHRASWRRALTLARDNAVVQAPDRDDRTYWQHELDVFDRVFAAPTGYRKCEFCGCNTNARARACCEQGRQADKKGT